MADDFDDNDASTDYFKKVEVEEDNITDNIPEKENNDAARPHFRVLSDTERLQLEIDALRRNVNQLAQAMTALRGITLIALGVAGFAYFKSRNNHSELNESTDENKGAPIAVVSSEE